MPAAHHWAPVEQPVQTEHTAHSGTIWKPELFCVPGPNEAFYARLYLDTSTGDLASPRVAARAITM